MSKKSDEPNLNDILAESDDDEDSSSDEEENKAVPAAPE